MGRLNGWPFYLFVLCVVTLIWGCKEKPVSGSLGGAPPAEVDTVDPGEGSAPPVLETCNSTSPILLDSLQNIHAVGGQSLAVSGNFAYVGTTGAGNLGVQIIDITDPANLVNRGYFLTSSGPGKIGAAADDVLGVLVSGNVLYLATYGGALVTVDVSDPDSPTFLDAIDFSGETWRMVKSGNNLFVCSPVDGLHVIDISSPSSLSYVTLSSYPCSDGAVNGNTFFGVKSDKIFSLDITNPGSPVLLDDVARSFNETYRIYIKDQKLYANNNPAKTVDTYDISNPSAITYVESSSAGAYAYRGITSYAGLVFVASGSGSSGAVEVYSGAGPSTSLNHDYTHSGGKYYEIGFSNDVVYAIRSDGFLEAIQVCL